MTEGERARTRLAAGLTLGALAAAAPVSVAELAPWEPVALGLAALAGLGALVFLHRYGPRFGPRHLLDLALPLAALVLLVLSLFDPLGLPARVRLVTHPLLGAAGATALWGLNRLPESEGLSWLWGGLAGLAFGLLAVFAGLSSLAQLTPTIWLLLAWRAILAVPDPIRPGNDPLDPYVPWADVEARREWPGLSTAVLRAPGTLGYLAASWALFLAWAEQTPDGLGLDQARFEPYLYAIPDLSRAPLEAIVSLGTAPWLNHDLVQLVYVTALLLLFGFAVEVREGTWRAAGVFVAGTLAGAIVAGVLLHGLISLFPDVGLLEHAWERTWSGGSAGAFALMGALASRAREPGPLLAFFVFWEANVGVFYLESFTPAFHLTALAVGFVLARRWEPTPGAATS